MMGEVKNSIRKSIRGVKSPLLVCCIFTLWSVDAPLCADGAGKVTVVRGDAVCRRVGVSTPRTVKNGDFVLVADLIETGKNGKVQILLSDDTVVDLMPGSGVRISQYSYDREKSRRSAVATVKQGTVHFMIYKELRGGSSFTVETEHALVQTALADLVVVTSNQQTELYTLAGYSSIRNSSNLVVGNISAGENQYVVVRAKIPPTPPAVIPSLQRRKFIKDARQF